MFFVQKCIVQWAQGTLHDTWVLCIKYCAIRGAAYKFGSTLHTVHCTLYTAHCTLNSTGRRMLRAADKACLLLSAQRPALGSWLTPYAVLVLCMQYITLSAAAYSEEYRPPLKDGAHQECMTALQCSAGMTALQCNAVQCGVLHYRTTRKPGAIWQSAKKGGKKAKCILV